MAITVKHKFVSAIPDGTDATIVRPSNWNDDHDLTGTIPVANGGTGASTAADGLNNLLPSQTGNNGKVLATDGTNASWTTNGSGDVVGPASATDNAITRFDGTTGKLIQNSVVTMDDTGTIAGATLTSPKINEILDTNGNEILGLSPTTSATDYLVVKNGIGVGVPLHVYADGTSANTGLHIQPKGTGLVTISDGTDFNKGIRFRSSSSAASAITLLDAVSTAGRVVTLPDATTTLVGRDTTDTLTNKTLTSPVISGGTINNAAIGATTASTGNFTTITGQTEVLKGTGQNLVIYSEQFDNAAWTIGTGTITANTTTAPNGTLTADTFTSPNSAVNGLYQSASVIPNTQYTFSVYVQLGTMSVSNYLIAVYNNTASAFIASDITPSQTATTGSWTRITYSFTTPASCVSVRVYPFRNSLAVAGTIYLWGAQLELASSVGSYIQTTTTAVYGTPSLSFSGVAGIGLESNGALYVSPAGTGAIQAQATTSSAVGGNARGANAVDWQTVRDTAAKVASGANSIVGGGQRNSATGAYSQALGGYNNTSSGFESVLVGGQTNQASGQISFIGGGTAHSSAGYGSAIVGGTSNTTGGVYSFVGGGQLNSGTSATIVTTQSATMNATTAVTLAASNAAIKVGQYISGTSIATDTYVAAVSGTSLTLSIAASGSSTSTLSFFTPHGVVVGGGNNQATGSYSFIGGGGDAGTAANRNVASGDWSAVVGGISNTASGIASFVGGGGSIGSSIGANLASGNASVVAGGWTNTASGNGSTVIGGYNNLASGTRSVAMGRYATTRGVIGNITFSACDVPISGAGISQASLLVLARETTNATATVLTSDANAASGTNQVILPNNSAYYFKGWAVSNVTGGGNTKGWEISGVIKRGANAAATSIVGTATVVSSFADAGAATWALTATADTTNGGLAITFTGQASTTIRTVCKIETVECTY